MRRWKLSRKQKVARNLLIIAAALFMMSWLQDFPALTVTGVIRRAEQEYLLEPVSELLLRERANGRWRVMAINGESLLTVEYRNRLTGKSTVTEELFEPGMKCVLYYSIETVDSYYEGDRVRYYEEPRFEAWGLLMEAASAELFWETGNAEEQYLLIFPGEKSGDHRFVFTEHYRYPVGGVQTGGEHGELFSGGDYSKGEKVAVLRTYDAAGELLTEWEYPNFWGSKAYVVNKTEGTT